MDLTPTVKTCIRDQDLPATALALMEASPKSSPLQIWSEFVKNSYSKEPLTRFIADEAVLIESGITVSGFDKKIVQECTFNGDRYLVLESGDVVNISADGREIATKLLKEMMKAT